MNNIILIDGNKSYSFSDLVKLYGSEERVLINIYNWEKNNKIKMICSNTYERVY